MSEPDVQQLKSDLMAAMPPDETPIGNRILREKLGWDEELYRRVREDLIQEGMLQPGPGRGGSVRRLDLQRLRQQFLDALPPGAALGNVNLRRKLGWDADQYERIKHELLAAGAVQLGRGYGGSVRRVEEEQEDSHAPEPISPSGPEASGPSRREHRLYPGFHQSLERWADDQDWTARLVHLTADQGRKSTGGSWTRPDFVVIGYKRFEYTPGVVRDIVTFEVKLDGWGIEAVFETAAHSRVATKSYLALQRLPDKQSSADLKRIESECQRFGVGLITFEDPADYESWEYLVWPTRQEPDPSLLDKFIEDQIPREKQRLIRTWLR